MTDKTDLNKYRYHGFLSGYANATGRPLGFAVTNNDAALGAFNQGYEAGFGHGRAGLDGLIEYTLAEKAHAYCGNCRAKAHAAQGGRLPPKQGVASICGPARSEQTK